VAPVDARVGGKVPVTLRVENRGAKAVDLYLRGRTITFDVVVTREDGSVVWRRLEGEVIPAIVHLRVLRRGEVLELRTQWDQRSNDGATVLSGRYLLRGQLLMESESLTSPEVQIVLK
jgi:hypothetical protein